ncbi:DUF2255 family protein [Nocardia sp. CA2R105]|uniref:DUF2255 family protein n=1 Tax=Nocardia coffeae TaxID=2873381 RepID=UPI001CA6087D|nr:DUF2255 family protein [Nocardia coffeae]MBY8856938.1 DUF2255 family protein [Nocardia coffeae]
MPWTSDQLDRIGDAEELHITSYRDDGSLRRWIPIWVVRVGDDLYIRSAYGAAGGWYRNAMRHRAARIRADGVECDVTLDLIGDADTNALVRRAYEAKYRDQPSALEPMVAPTAAETTLRVTAAG